MQNTTMLKLRLSRKENQEDVARTVGVTQSAYAMIEGGHRHPRKVLQKQLAIHFGVTVDELFYSHDNYDM